MSRDKKPLKRNHDALESRRRFIGHGTRAAGGLILGGSFASLPGCGGGGGGGSPTSPSANSGAPPATGNAVVTGRFVNLENGNPFSGATVTVGSRTATTDAQGNFRVEGVGGGEQVITLSGGGSLERKLKIGVNAGATNNYGTIDTVPSDFPLAFFSKNTRPPGGYYPPQGWTGSRPIAIPDGTVRWTTRPAVYADRDTLSALPFKWSEMEKEIRRHVGESYPAISNGFMSGLDVSFVGTSQMPAMGTRDVILVRGGTADGGSAVHYEWADGTNTFYSALVEFSRSIGYPAIAQDMCQPLGFVIDYPGAGGDSLFWDSQGLIRDPQPKDVRMGKYLYSRPPGTKSQDDTSHLAALGASAATVGATPFAPSRDGNQGEPLLLPVEVGPLGAGGDGKRRHQNP